MYFAFGIAALVLAVISIFVPGVGIMIAGLSGFLAWISIGKGLPFGAVAVILNLINVVFLSPAFMAIVRIEASLRTLDQTEDFRIWAIVLFVQIAAVVIFICNFIIDKVLEHRQQRKRQASAIDEKPTAPAAPWLSAEGNRLNQSAGNTEDIPQITKVLIDKIHGGRKNDSKFWTADHDFGGGDGAGMPIRISPEHAGPEKLRKAFGIPSYPIIALIIVVAVFIIVMHFVHTERLIQ